MPQISEKIKCNFVQQMPVYRRFLIIYAYCIHADSILYAELRDPSLWKERKVTISTFTFTFRAITYDVYHMCSHPIIWRLYWRPSSFSYRIVWIWIHTKIVSWAGSYDWYIEWIMKDIPMCHGYESELSCDTFLNKIDAWFTWDQSNIFKSNPTCWRHRKAQQLFDCS